MGGPNTLIWRGVRVDPRTASMLDEVARLTPDLPVLSPSQGSYNTSVGASAGTHAGGGAVDIRCSNLTASQAVEVVRIMRIVGFAAWRRMPSEGPWPEHIHGVAVGQRDLSPAAARQVDGRNANGDPVGLRNGRNGLANNGLDPHRNLNLPVVTWEQYQKERTMEPAELRRALHGDNKFTGNRIVKHTDKNEDWFIRTGRVVLDRHTGMLRELLAGQAQAETERAAQRELLVQLAARDHGVELSDAQVRELADRIAAAGAAACVEIGDRLTAAAEAMLGDDPDED